MKDQNQYLIAICGTHLRKNVGQIIHHVFNSSELESELVHNNDFNSYSTIVAIADPMIKKILLIDMDETQDSFTTVTPDITVLTDLSMSHTDVFSDFQAYTDRFEKLLLNTKGIIVANLADENVADMMKWIRKHTNAECLDYSRHMIETNLDQSEKMAGLAAFQIGLLLDIEPTKIIQAINTFKKGSAS